MSAQPKALDLVRLIPESIRKMKSEKLSVRPCKSNQCSEIGHDCERYLTYRRLNWKQQEVPSVEAQYVFDEGHQQEISIRRILEDVGYEITQTNYSFSWDEHQITGTIDGFISGDRDGHWDQPIPYDAKSMSPWVYMSVNSLEDFQKYPWTRKYPAQLVMYMLLTNTEESLFVLKNKSNGQIKLIALRLDDFLEQAEEWVQRAERINKHVEEKTYPDRIDYDHEVCGKCSFSHLCLPEENCNGLMKLNSDEIIALVERTQELKDSKSEYDQADKELKGMLKLAVQEETPILVKDKWIIVPKKVEKGGKEFMQFRIKPIEKARI